LESRAKGFLFARWAAMIGLGCSVWEISMYRSLSKRLDEAEADRERLIDVQNPEGSMESCACPLCGGRVQGAGIRFAERIVVSGTRSVHLTRGDAIIFGALFRAWPGFVVKERLYQLYVADRPLEMERPSEKIVDVYIHRLRRKLAGLDVGIETAWGGGYRLLEHAADDRVLTIAE
jgi:Transcriptional regulatory protein, C terminal